MGEGQGEGKYQENVKLFIWKSIEWVKLRLLDEKRISPEDLDILQVMDEPEEIVKAVKKVIIVWMRLVDAYLPY